MAKLTTQEQLANFEAAQQHLKAAQDLIERSLDGLPSAYLAYHRLIPLLIEAQVSYDSWLGEMPGGIDEIITLLKQKVADEQQA